MNTIWNNNSKNKINKMSEKNKPKLEFTPNIPYEITFLFAKPISGKGSKTLDNGKIETWDWWNYGVKYNGKEYAFFPSEKLHDKIEYAGLKKGDTCIITQKAEINEDTKKPFIDYELAVNGKIIRVSHSEKAIEKEMKKDEKKPEAVNSWNERDKGMLWGNSKNNATNLIIALIQKGDINLENVRIDKIKEMIYDTACWYYKLEMPFPESIYHVDREMAMNDLGIKLDPTINANASTKPATEKQFLNQGDLTKQDLEWAREQIVEYEHPEKIANDYMNDDERTAFQSYLNKVWDGLSAPYQKAILTKYGMIEKIKSRKDAEEIKKYIKSVIDENTLKQLNGGK